MVAEKSAAGARDDEPPDPGERHRLSVPGGLAALSLDAMASVAYARIGERLQIGRTPAPPRPRRALVIVPVAGVDLLARHHPAAALSLGDRMVPLPAADAVRRPEPAGSR